jgi:hypothetical protein
MQQPILRMAYPSDATCEQTRSNASNLNVKFGNSHLESTHLK